MTLALNTALTLFSIEKKPIHEYYIFATEELSHVRDTVVELIRSKVTVIEIKETMRNVLVDLQSHSETYGE